MFTGIIQIIGEVASINKEGDWLVSIKASPGILEQLPIGGSICCSGICLTVVKKKKTSFEVQLSMETLNRTTALNWKVGTQLNLEPALCFGDALGGHLLTGHVDGLAYLVDKRPEGDSVRLRFEAPSDYTRFIAMKGSVALDGISLTINEVMRKEFGVNIIPHTQKNTTFSTLSLGDAVNFEVDMIARYVERIMNNKDNF